MKTKNSAFTLVEILIVVIILGILAAIVIPQFTEASNDARRSSLLSDLQTLRSQIELFKIQHNDMLPGYVRADDGTLGSWSADTLETQLTTQTDVNGNAGTQFGPYLQKFPTNQFVSADGDQVGEVGSPSAAGPGWAFDPNTGRISPNDPTYSGS